MGLDKFLARLGELDAEATYRTTHDEAARMREFVRWLESKDRRNAAYAIAVPAMMKLVETLKAGLLSQCVRRPNRPCENDEGYGRCPPCKLLAEMNAIIAGVEI